MITKTVETKPYNDQKMGTAGLRKKSKAAMQENYFENFIQSIFDVIGGVKEKVFVIGGDGRYFNDKAKHNDNVKIEDLEFMVNQSNIIVNQIVKCNKNK